MFDLPPPPPVAAIELRLPDAASRFNPTQPFHLSASLQTGLRASLKPSLSAPRMSSIRLAANETATDAEKLQSIEQTEAEDSQQDAEVTGRFTPGTLRDRQHYHPMLPVSQTVIWKGERVVLTHQFATPNYDANGNIPLDSSRSTLGPYKIYNGVYNLDDHVVRGTIYPSPYYGENIAYAIALKAPYFHEVDRVWTDKGVEYKKGAFAVTPFTKFVIRNVSRNRIEHVIWPQNDPQIDFDKLGFLQGDTYQLISYRRKRANQGTDQRNGVTFTITTPIDISDVQKNMEWHRPELKYRVSGYVKLTRGANLSITDNWPGIGEVIVKDKDKNGYAYVEFFASPSGGGYTHAFFFTDKATNYTEVLKIPVAPPDPGWAAPYARYLKANAARVKSQWSKIFGADKSISAQEFYNAAKRATGENKKAMNALMEHTSEGRTIFGIAAGRDLRLTPDELANFINHTTQHIARGKYGYVVDRKSNSALWHIAFPKEQLLYDQYIGASAPRFGSKKRITTGALTLATYLMDVQVHTNYTIKDEAYIRQILGDLAKMHTVGPGVVDVAKWVGMRLDGTNRRIMSEDEDDAPQANDDAPQSADITPQVDPLLSQADLMMRLPALGNLGGGVERRLLALHERRFTREQLYNHLPAIFIQVRTAHEAIATEMAGALVDTPNVFIAGTLGRRPMQEIQKALSKILFFTAEGSYSDMMAARRDLRDYLFKKYKIPRSRTNLVMDAVVRSVYFDEEASIDFLSEHVRNQILNRFYSIVPPHPTFVATLPGGGMAVANPDPDLSLFRANLHDEL